MEPLSPEEQKGLTRERLVDAALGLIDDEGLEGLSMRALADRLQVKAASLYWHVRDRDELLQLLADAILESVSRPRQRATWRDNVQATADALHRAVAGHKDASRILLEVSGALARSDVARDLATAFRSAGLQDGEAADVARMVMTQVIAAPSSAGDEPAAKAPGEPASVWIDTGSRGVILRAGTPDMSGLIRVPPDQSGAAPAVVRGEQVLVRRLRGVGRGEIELNPRRPWKFKVQAPTWNTVIDAGGLDLREIWIDSGASNIECFLPEPRGVIPIHVSSGVVNVSVHRPREAAVAAIVHTGAFKLKLEQFSTNVAVFDMRWNSDDGAPSARDRYELDVSSGVVDFKLDTYAPKVRPLDATPAEPKARVKASTALDFLLDGIEAHLKSAR
ncbi:MAG TPA: TetR family transcriptional regulator [Candidatus Dormibacteraeota bacterium]|nr:TetR family transcriptional regulator [Candidatus Dormibacteraeota bacterium]